MASFPVSTAASPDIKPARNGKQKRLGEQRKITGLSASDLRERNKTLERQRRKSMNELFHALHSLLPHPIPKTCQVTILDEMIKYIPVARTKLDNLKKAKALLLSGSIGNTTEDTDHRLNDLRIDAAIKVDGNRVDITVWCKNKWAPLEQILNELEIQGLELINCSSFISDTKFFHHFNTKCLDASLLSCESLRSTLQRIDSPKI